MSEMFVPSEYWCVRLSVWLMLMCNPWGVVGHGSLVDPPQRGVMWKYGFNTPKNYNYNELNCGGYQNQWLNNGGRCGLCGDPYDGERNHEDGGVFATGTVAKTYTSGSTIHVKVILTANHRGWFEFRLCPRNTTNEPLSQICLDRHLLSLPSGGTRYFPLSQSENVVKLLLPKGVTCRQCVLQWKYNAGNSWGCFGADNCCMGCGSQEQFLNCADVAIITEDEGNSADLNRIVQLQTHHQVPTFTTSIHVYKTESTESDEHNDKSDEENDDDEEKETVNKNSKTRIVNYINRQNDNVIPTLTTPQKLRDLVLAKLALSRSIIRNAVITCRSIGVWKTVSGMNVWCGLNCGPNVFKPSPGCSNYCSCY